MTSVERSRILLICPSEDRAEIADILSGGGYETVEHDTGGATTVGRFQELDPDVAIVYATLEHGDVRSLTAKMREHGGATRLILIGDADGPVRNALDAADFGVDRFLARPLASKALLFAVRACVEAAQRARQQAAEASSATLERKMASAMDQAIDEFVRTAMDALPIRTHPAPYPLASSSPTLAPPERDDEGPSGKRTPRKRRKRPTLESIPPPPDQPAAVAPPPTPPTPTPRAPRLPVSRPPALTAGADGSAGEPTGEPGATTPLPGLHDRPSPRSDTGAFARQLRRKMSDMAARLFPAKQGKAPVDLGVAHSHADEIDLSSLGVDTVVEGTGDSAALDQLAGTSQVAEERSGAPERTGEVASLDLGSQPAKGVKASASPASMGASQFQPESDDSGNPFASPVLTSASRSGSASRTTASGRAAQPASSSRDDELPFQQPDGPRAGDAGARVQASAPATGDELARKGSIRRGQVDAAILIERMHRQRFTGKVEFHSQQAIKAIIFDKGRLVFASSNLHRDRMGEQLFREGKITADQLDHVREIVSETGRRMGEVLIEVGWLKRRELLPVVRRHIEDLVYSLFAWDDGQYRVVAGDFAAGERIRISRHPAAMILEGVRRKFDGDSLQTLVGGPDSIIEITDDRNLRSVMSVADLSAAERKVMTSFDGERTLAEIHAQSAIELTDVYQLAYGLVVWGAARSLRRGTQARSAATDEPALIGETDLAIDRQRVEAKYSLVVDADYFALLGVRRDATSFEVKRAYQAARQDYANEGFPAEIRGELGGKLDEINEVLEEAYMVLRDDILRASYLANLRD